MQTCYYRTRIGTLKSFSRSAAPSTHFWPCLQQSGPPAQIYHEASFQQTNKVLFRKTFHSTMISDRVAVEGGNSKRSLACQRGPDKVSEGGVEGDKATRVSHPPE